MQPVSELTVSTKSPKAADERITFRLPYSIPPKAVPNWALLWPFSGEPFNPGSNYQLARHHLAKAFSTFLRKRSKLSGGDLHIVMDMPVQRAAFAA